MNVYVYIHRTYMHRKPYNQHIKNLSTQIHPKPRNPHTPKTSQPTHTKPHTTHTQKPHNPPTQKPHNLTTHTHPKTSHPHNPQPIQTLTQNPHTLTTSQPTQKKSPGRRWRKYLLEALPLDEGDAGRGSRPAAVLGEGPASLLLRAWSTEGRKGARR